MCRLRPRPSTPPIYHTHTAWRRSDARERARASAGISIAPRATAPRKRRRGGAMRCATARVLPHALVRFVSFRSFRFDRARLDPCAAADPAVVRVVEGVAEDLREVEDGRVEEREQRRACDRCEHDKDGRERKRLCARKNAREIRTAERASETRGARRERATTTTREREREREREGKPNRAREEVTRIVGEHEPNNHQTACGSRRTDHNPNARTAVSTSASTSSWARCVYLAWGMRVSRRGVRGN